MRPSTSSRWILRAALAFVAAAASVACDLDQLMQSGGSGSGEASDAGAGEGGGADASVQGAGCGVEGETNTTLCRAVSSCPTVVIDSQAFPNCGFRIRGSVADLVCACGPVLCSMGTYTTCAQAAQLLTTQTEQQVCLQSYEGRCAAASPAGSSSSGSSGQSGTCDRACLAECGGGGACASLCGCS